MVAIERNTWFFLGSNSSEQLLYCLKRINDPSREHVGNSFTPVPQEAATAFFAMRDAVVKILERTINMLQSNDMTQAEAIRTDSQAFQATLSRHRKEMLDRMHDNDTYLEAMLVYINIVQESQVLVSTLRHLIRGVYKFQMG